MNELEAIAGDDPAGRHGHRLHRRGQGAEQRHRAASSRPSPSRCSSCSSCSPRSSRASSAPFILIATVPFGLAAAVFAMLLTGGSLNIYSQIGLVMLVGLMAKNGILIVEFANQLRDAGPVGARGHPQRRADPPAAGGDDHDRDRARRPAAAPDRRRRRRGAPARSAGSSSAASASPPSPRCS